MSGIEDQGLGPEKVEPAPVDESDPHENAEEPSTQDLREPSTEKEPGEEPKAPDRTDPEPSHEAVGIGIIGRPQTEMEDESD